MVGRLDREERATYAVDQGNNGVSTRSCLSFNLLKKKKQRQLPPRPEKGQTTSASRSRAVHPVTPPTPYSNDGQDYYSYHNNNSNGDSMQSLLVPPTPVDRSPRTLAAAASSNNQKNTSSSSSRPRRGLYQGELEPVGVRGQEAAVVQNTQQDDGEALPHLRQFSSPSILAPVHEQAPLQFSPQTGQAVRFVPPTSNSATKPSSFRTSITTTRSTNSNYHSSSPRNPSNSSSWSISMKQPRQPKRLLSDAESTASDDDIRYMMADWMPSMEADDEPEQDNNTPVGTNMNHRPQQQQELESLNAAALENVRTAQYDQALQQFQAILAIHMHDASNTSSKNANLALQASTYHNLGTVHAKRAALQPEDSVAQRQCRSLALEAFQAAARAARDSLGPQHPNVAVSLVRIGFLLLQSRQYRHAITTFREALRIRTVHYSSTNNGVQHGLVANLYNNLGVCYMHLHEFQTGKQHLQAALRIQRQLVAQQAENNNNNPNDSEEEPSWVHQLELADTLFNLGGLHLEWIRKQGPHVRRRDDAVQAFLETYQIRKKILGPQDASVVQVKALLDMAKAIPGPVVLSPKMDSPYVQTAAAAARTLPQRHSPRVSPIDTATTKSPQEILAGLPPRRSPRLVSPAGQSVSSSLSPTADLELPSMTTARDGSPLDQRHASSPARSLDPPGSTLPASSSLRASSLATNTRKLCVPTKQTRRQYQSHMPDGGGNSSSSIFRSRNDASNQIDNHDDMGGGSSSPAVRVLSAVSTMSSTRAFSRDEAENKEPFPKQQPRIFVEPHLVPASPARPTNDVSNEATGSFSHELSVDTSSENQQRQQLEPQRSYDAEENCLLHDTGIDSEQGRVHYPSTWKNQVEDESISSAGIVVARPYRSNPSSRGVTSTGNRDRDDVLKRARAILSAAHTQSTDAESTRGGDDESSQNVNGKEMGQVDLLEDGIAPLGGNWPSSKDKNEAVSVPVRDMVRDPMNHLPEIHEEAARLLKDNYTLDALDLFEVVLQCQRRRHGPLHPDVASALHNCGIAQLRAQNHEEALAAFEEAARVRKGSLGRDHPHVAISLVKVGITLLLLHRFDDALWSFREALSVRKKALGPLHPSTARIYNNIGCVHVEFNEFKEARKAFEAALDVQRNALCNDPDSGPLMFGTATTLCNLGYLYRYRDMHGKASLVLKEAVDLQESVLGRSHATVLSTLDNLADSYANSGHAVDALRTYNMILERFRVGGRSENGKMARAEAVLLYKMSRVHRQRNDRAAQLDSLKLAMRAIRTFGSDKKPDSLERRIQYDIRACREQLEKDELKWV